MKQLFFFRCLREGAPLLDDDILCEDCVRKFKRTILNRVFGRKFHCNICGAEN